MYKPYDTSDVVIATGLRSKVIVLDTVKMKIFNRVIQTLDDVKHVPSLKKNFPLLSKLVILGYDFSIKNGFMNIGKGSLVVVK